MNKKILIRYVIFLFAIVLCIMADGFARVYWSTVAMYWAFNIVEVLND